MVGFEAYREAIPALAVDAALLGDESGWITAQNIEVSGGFGL